MKSNVTELQVFMEFLVMQVAGDAWLSIISLCLCSPWNGSGGRRQIKRSLIWTAAKCHFLCVDSSRVISSHHLPNHLVLSYNELSHILLVHWFTQSWPHPIGVQPILPRYHLFSVLATLILFPGYILCHQCASEEAEPLRGSGGNREWIYHSFFKSYPQLILSPGFILCHQCALECARPLRDRVGNTGLYMHGRGWNRGRIPGA